MGPCRLGLRTAHRLAGHGLRRRCSGALASLRRFLLAQLGLLLTLGGFLLTRRLLLTLPVWLTLHVWLARHLLLALDLTPL